MNRNNRTPSPEVIARRQVALRNARAYREHRETLHQRLADVVANARLAGLSWPEIAEALGCTREGLAQRLNGRQPRCI